jgi:hypothetical protein
VRQTSASVAPATVVAQDVFSNSVSVSGEFWYPDFSLEMPFFGVCIVWSQRILPNKDGRFEFFNGPLAIKSRLKWD